MNRQHQQQQPSPTSTTEAPQSQQTNDLQPYGNAAAAGDLYTVESGDTLSGIAGLLSGDTLRYMEMYEINRDQISDPDLIDVGWQLDVPNSWSAPQGEQGAVDELGQGRGGRGRGGAGPGKGSGGGKGKGGGGAGGKGAEGGKDAGGGGGSGGGIDEARQLIQSKPGGSSAEASWIMTSADQGFSNYTDASTEGRLEQISGEKNGEDYEALGVMVALVWARVERWVDGNGQGNKDPLSLGSFIRDQDTRGHQGESIDLNNLDTAADVIQVLSDLPPGNYGIGLPYGGDFFQANKEYNEANQKAAEAMGGTPTMNDVTQKGYTSTYNMVATRQGSGWSWPSVEGGTVAKSMGALDHISNASLRDALSKVNGYVFPDNPAHMHIQVN
jgi:hypothetical protein